MLSGEFFRADTDTDCEAAWRVSRFGACDNNEIYEIFRRSTHFHIFSIREIKNAFNR